jgi:hypothetical protein
MSQTLTAVPLGDRDPALAELWRLPVGKRVVVMLLGPTPFVTGTLLDVVFVDRVPAVLVVSHSIADHVLVPWHGAVTITEEISSS